MQWNLVKLALIIASIPLLTGCDPDGLKKCDWVLEPEPSLKGKTDPGFIPVCARNRKTNKQDCRLQTTLEYAKSVYGKKFRYVDLRIKSPGLPRTVTSVDFCE
jgi:hypothetical protein